MVHPERFFEESNENPVYYIQYAHARICSIIREYNKETTALLYIDEGNDKTYTSYAVIENREFTIGRDTDQNIVFDNNYIALKHATLTKDEKGFKIPMNHEDKTSLEAKEYFNKLQEVVSKNSLKLNYYETEADSKLEDISFEPNGDYEQILRLIVLSDTKNYNDKTLRLGVITLDLESALYSRLNRKEQPNELCNI